MKRNKNGRLLPPKTIADLGDWARKKIEGNDRRYAGVATIEKYVTEYHKGRRDAGSSSESTPWHTGNSTWAYDDGYLDAAAGREIWHYAYCPDPDTCGEH